MGFINRVITNTLPLVPKGVIRHFSRKYIAGEALEDAAREMESLKLAGFMATLDVLGEDVTRAEETERAVDEYLAALQLIAKRGLPANISIKPTQLGLKVDLDLCHKNFSRLCEEAQKHQNFVRLDMEDSSCTSETLDLYFRLRETFGDRVGVVIQAYLRRTHLDLDRLIDAKANVRLCKGIYIEPPALAFRDGSIVNRSYTHLLERLLRGGCYVGIATHDDKLVYEAEHLIRQLSLEPDQYEFQMLLGVQRQLRDVILSNGHRLRVYIPYGRDWYAYSTRRLKENPTLVSHILKAMFRKDE